MHCINLSFLSFKAKYLQFEYINDAVLVELREPLQFGRNVSAVCLPNKDIEPKQQLCVTAGWGVTKPGGKKKIILNIRYYISTFIRNLLSNSFFSIFNIIKSSNLLMIIIFSEPNKQQYLHYLPVPMIENDECNSTKHYNGQMSKDKICAGYIDSDRAPCYVSTVIYIFFCCNIKS